MCTHALPLASILYVEEASVALVTADRRNSPFLDAVARKARGRASYVRVMRQFHLLFASCSSQPSSLLKKEEASSRSSTSGQLLTPPKPQFEIAEPIGYRHIRYNTIKGCNTP